MKTVLMDSSSAILLYKSDILMTFLRAYRILIPPSVYIELTKEGKPGAEMFQDLPRHSLLKLLTPAETDPSRTLIAVNQTLGKGEKELLSLYRQGVGDFLLIDDLAAAKICLRENIPYTSALLIPRILARGGMLCESCRHQLTLHIFSLGRYSPRIHQKARSMSENELYPFLP